MRTDVTAARDVGDRVVPFEVTIGTSGYRWVILSVAWGSYVITYVDRLAWGNIATTASAALGLTIATLGSFVTSFYIGYVLSNVGGGLMTDRLGGHRMIAYALIPLGALTYAFSYTTSLWSGVVIQALMGLAAGADYAAGIAILTRWFPVQSRAKAMGLFITGTSIGVLLTNASVPHLLQIIDWRTVYRLLGGVTVLYGVFCLFALRPADVPVSSAPERKLPLFVLFREKDLIFVALAGFGGYWGAWGFAFWASALMVKGHGMTLVQAGYATAMFGAAAAIAKPIMGAISDWLGGARRLPVFLCLLAFGATLLVFGSMETFKGFMFTAPFLGLFSFAYTPPLAALISEIVGPARTGSATGLTNAVWQIGNVLVPLVVGAVFARTASFHAAFMALAIGPFFGALAMFFVTERNKKPLNSNGLVDCDDLV